METKGIEPFTRCVQNNVANPWNIRPRAKLLEPLLGLHARAVAVKKCVVCVMALRLFESFVNVLCP